MPDENNGFETFVVFELAGTTYAVRSQLVQQMEMIEQITSVPNAPPSIEGVVFSRGRVVPVVNLRSRFGFEKIPIELRTRLIVIDVEGRIVGLMVDSAREFMSIEASEIQPPGEAISGMSGKYLEGIATIGNRPIMILDLSEVINLSEIIGNEQTALTGSQHEKA